MTRNSWTIARNFNAVMDEIGRAIILKSEALWVYKQGPSYVSRYLSNKTKDTEKQIFPGEGCRVYFQREKIKTALGI